MVFSSLVMKRVEFTVCLTTKGTFLTECLNFQICKVNCHGTGDFLKSKKSLRYIFTKPLLLLETFDQCIKTHLRGEVGEQSCIFLLFIVQKILSNLCHLQETDYP